MVCIALVPTYGPDAFRSRPKRNDLDIFHREDSLWGHPKFAGKIISLRWGSISLARERKVRGTLLRLLSQPPGSGQLAENGLMCEIMST